MAEMVLFRLGPDQNVVPTPRSREFAPFFPPPLPPAGSGTGAKGLGRELISSSFVGAASPGAYRPLTDLGKCSSDERAQETPHSCAALAPMLVVKHRST